MDRTFYCESNDTYYILEKLLKFIIIYIFNMYYLFDLLIVETYKFIRN